MRSCTLQRRISSLLFLLICYVGLWADDTIRIVSEEYAGIYEDTIRLQELPSAIDQDELLLYLVAQQSKSIFTTDSARCDSILNDLSSRKEQLLQQLASIQDSISLLRQEQQTYIGYQYDEQEELETDYIEEIDSLQLTLDSAALERLNNTPISRQYIEKSIFKDKDADLQDIKVAIRNSRSPWRKEANVMIHLTQNYISPNWYKGGNSNFSILSLLKGNINYKKGDITWENSGEWRTGVSTTSNDTLRKFNVTEDIFRLYSKVGYQVAEKLYVSVSAEFNTTLWNVWNTNNSTVKTAFFTPAKFYLNLGIDYKPLKGLSIFVAPATYKMVYSYYPDGDSIHNVDVTNYGIPAGNQLLNEFGSVLRVQWKWKPLREIALDTEFYFYTNYHAVELDWEINCDFIINRFLTTRISLHPRYDSTPLNADEGQYKMQFKELLSIGFSHKFR